MQLFFLNNIEIFFFLFNSQYSIVRIDIRSTKMSAPGTHIQMND